MVKPTLCLLLAMLALLGCSARDSEHSAALAPVPEDELPRFEPRESASSLDVGVIGRPAQSPYVSDIPMDFPEIELTPEEQAELDRREQEQFTYDYLDLADYEKPSPMVSNSRGGSQPTVSEDRTQVGITTSSKVSRASTPSVKPGYSQPVKTSARSSGRGGANPRVSSSNAGSIGVTPPTTIASVSR